MLLTMLHSVLRKISEDIKPSTTVDASIVLIMTVLMHPTGKQTASLERIIFGGMYSSSMSATYHGHESLWSVSRSRDLDDNAGKKSCSAMEVEDASHHVSFSGTTG